MKERNIKSILFDMDGVIIDSEPMMVDMLKKTLKRMGVDADNDDFKWLIGVSSLEIASVLIEKYKLEMKPEEFRSENLRTGNIYTDLPDLQPVDGLVELMDRLKEHGFRMAVVSSTSSRNVLAALNRFALIKYFDAIICGDLVRVTKPNPEGYLRAASLLESAPESCLVIEDSPIGIMAAINAGIQVAAFNGTVYKQDCSKADYVFDDYQKLWGILKENSKLIKM